MRRLQVFLSVLLLFLFSPSFAQSQVDSVKIYVELQDDGSALIRERWVIDVSDNITEWYLGRENLGTMQILDFKVSDESGRKYVYEGTGWDIHRSRSDKAGRCGIVTTYTFPLVPGSGLGSCPSTGCRNSSFIQQYQVAFLVSV